MQDYQINHLNELGYSPDALAQRRPAENLQIACGYKHFALAEGVAFKDVTTLEGLRVGGV